MLVEVYARHASQNVHLIYTSTPLLVHHAHAYKVWPPSQHAVVTWPTQLKQSRLHPTAALCCLAPAPTTLCNVQTTIVPLQVAFLNAASTPREIKLLHAPTLTSAFRLLPAQLTISTQDANRQLQHSMAVTSNIPVQRFLKVELSGMALENAAGRDECHAHMAGVRTHAAGSSG